MKKCSQCAEKIQDEARICKHCGHQFSEQELDETRKAQRNSALIKVGAAVGVLGLLIYSCNGRDNNQQPPATEQASIEEIMANREPDAPAPTPSPPMTNWRYQTKNDELRGKPIRAATVLSENSANFDFPYAGSNHMNLVIRSHPEHGTDLYFSIEKGQIQCNSYSEPCKGKISIDGKVETLFFNESASNDSTVVFATYPKALINKIKGSEKVIVELPFFREGSTQFTFLTAGLVWPPKEGA